MIVFNRTTTGRNAQQLGQALHASLIAAGWSLEYANTDAIGSGSASNPAWDKAQANASSAGSVVYKMPSSALATRWLLRFEIIWSTGADHVNLAMQTAKNVSGAGVLSDPGTICGSNLNGGPSNIAGEHIISASENGIAVGMGLENQYGAILCCERARDLPGNVLDEIVVHGMGINTAWVGLNGTGSSISRDAAGGEFGLAPYVYLARQHPTATQLLPAVTLKAAGNLRGLSAGPFIASGGIKGMSGHLLFIPGADTPPGTDQVVNVGGVDRTFFQASGAAFHLYNSAFLKA